MTEATVQSGYVAANGLNYYYEIRGEGEPLLLLHGGLCHTGMFEPILLPALAAERRVIGVDLHGHGRTALGERPISLIDMGDDMAVILASRIAAKAKGGEILVADTVRGLCSGKGFLFADRGEFVAKGFEEPVRVYEVRWR